MYLWSNTGYTGSETHVLGNSEIFVCANGPNIVSVSGPPYTSLPYFSAVIDDNTRDITALSERESGTGIWLYKLTCSDSPVISFKHTAAFMRFTDHIDCIRNVFVRRFNSIQSLMFKFIIPSYVKVYYYETYILSGKRYACASFTIPGRTAPYLNSEKRLLCVLDGDAYFNTIKNEIHIKSGSGNIIFALGTPDKSVRDAVYILGNYVRSIERTREYYTEYLRRICECALNITDKYVVKVVTALESAAVLLKTMQGSDGGVIKSISKPAADMSEQYYILRSFLALGCRSEAKAILAFMANKITLYGDITAYEDIFRESSVADYAYCLLSAAAYLRYSGDKSYITTLAPMIRHAVEYQIKNTNSDFIMSDICQPAIIGGYITHRAAYAVSACNTLLYIESLKETLYIEATVGQNLINNVSLNNAIKRAGYAFSNTFVQNDIFKSYAVCPDGTRRERFSYGICDMCGDMYYPRINTALERFGDNYLCERCFNKAAEFGCNIIPTEISDEIVTGDILLAPYLGCDTVKRDIVCGYIEKNEKDGFIPVVCGSNRKFNSDAGFLLYVLTEYDDARSAHVFRSLVDAVGKNGNWSEYNAFTNAVCAEAIIKYLKDRYK